MAHKTATHIERSNAYNIFIVILTIFSLVIMVLMFLPLDEETGGRVTAMFIMIAGIGIIGVLASLMSSLLVGSPSSDSAEEETPKIATTDREKAAIKKELAEMRKLLEKNCPG